MANKYSNKNPQQILRFDNKTSFFEVLNGSFPLGKVHVKMCKYDTKQASGSKITQSLEYYIDFNDFLLLANDVLSGKIPKMGVKSKQVAKEGGYKYAKHVFNLLSGISVKKLAQRGKSRPDGAALSRQIKLSPGSSQPWILSIENGPGEETNTGLIKPKGKPDERLLVSISDDDLKKLVLVVRTHIESYITSKYVDGSAMMTYQEKQAQQQAS